MKYYIFGTNKEREKISASKALFKSEYLYSAWDNFLKHKEENRFEYLYLIVDFESTPDKLLTCKTFDNDYSEVVPYLILANHCKNYETKDVKRIDLISIYTKGFKRQFSDNITALSCFENYLYSGKAAEMRIEYKKGNGRFDRFLSSTELKRKYKTKKFELFEPEWNVIPQKKRDLKLITIEEAV